MKQTIIYTTLPNGRATINGQQYLKVSLHCGIRLSHTSSTTMQQFPGIMQWAGKMKAAEGFKVRLNGSEPVDAQAETSVIDTGVWETLIHDGVKVSAFIVEDKSSLKIHSYPIKEMNESLLNVYRDFGVKSPVSLISPAAFLQNNVVVKMGRFNVDSQVVNAFVKSEDQTVRKATIRNDFKGLRVDRQSVLRYNIQQQSASDYRRILQSGNYNEMAAFNNQPEFQFARFRDFHKIDTLKRPVIQPPLEAPEFEFHDILAQMSDYPQMQRKLGLVIDLLVPVHENLSAEGTVSAYPLGIEFDEETEVSVTTTAYRLTGSGFYAREKSGSELRNGFVKLNTSEFSVAQIDTDGTAIQTINKVDDQLKIVAERTVVMQNRYKVMTPEEEEVDDEDDEKTDEEIAAEGLPVIRSAGIAIIKSQVEKHINARFQMARQLDQKLAAPITLGAAQRSQNIQIMGIRSQVNNIQVQILEEAEKVLFADDLVMGYRMDVAYSDNADKWYSLHYKQDEVVVYDENNNGYPVAGIEPDESFCQIAMTEDSTDASDVFVSGVIARWTGWSLAVERPGYAINEDDGTRDKDFINTDESEEAKKYGYHPEANVRMNVKSNTVAGTLPSLRYGKSYNLRMRYVDVAGNSVPLEAVPDDPGQAIVTGITYRRFEPVASPVILSANQFKVAEDIERMVIKSNVSVAVNDYHEPGVLPGDRESQRLFVPPSNSQLTAERHGKLDAAFSGNMAAAKAVYELICSHETAVGTNDAEDKVYSANEFELTYLPDPAAAGVAFFLADGYNESHTQFFTPRQVHFIPGGPSGPNGWLQIKPLTLRLVEGNISSQWDESARVLTFLLPKGHRAIIKYACFWNQEDLQTLSGMWHQLSQGGNFSSIREFLLKGQHWMVSPARELELVHAVQQPLIEPELNETLSERGYLDTPAWIKTKIKVNGQSTQKVELHAAWKDWEDNPLKPLPLEIDNSKILDPVTIKYKDQVRHVGYVPPKNPQFRVVNSMVPAVKVQQQPQQMRGNFQTQQQARTIRAGTVQPVITNNARTLKLLPVFSRAYVLKAWGLMHSFDDTRHRFVEYKPLATSRYSEYFKEKAADGTLTPVEGLELTREGKVVTVNILSSDRPLPPEVEYIIPTFNWHKTAEQDRLTHIRMGGGLRVYLKRPWFSSGEGEMLGLVLSPTGALSMVLSPEPPVRYSQWGTDPIFPFPGDRTYNLAHNNLKWQSKTDKGLVYPGYSNLKADVAGFPVKFDAERKLWYADLVIDPKERYFPFVKLMLARYQEHSLRISNSDVCLSPVVETDYVQLVPERKVQMIIERRGSVADRIKIEISGYRYQDFDNVFEIKILSDEIPQPLSGTISNAVPQKKTTSQEAPINDIRFPDQHRFIATGYFQLTPDLRKVPFDVVVLEYEKADVEGTRKLVFADEFRVNRE